MGRVVHSVVRLLGGAIALLVLLLALVAARLSAGPVSLGFLVPALNAAVDDLTPWRIEIGDAGLLWRDWRRGLLLRLGDVRASGAEGVEAGHIADLAIAFSPRALARGVLAPVSVSARDGEITLDLAKAETSPPPGMGDEGVVAADAPDSVAHLLAGLRGGPDVGRPLSFLLEADIRDVALRLHAPAGADWRLRIEHARFARDTAGRLAGDAVLTVAQGETSADATVALAPSADDEDLAVRVAFSGLRPAAFAAAAPELAPLAALDLPLRGEAGADIGAGGALRRVSVDVDGGAGALVLTDAFGRSFGPAVAPQRLAVRSLALHGEWIAAERALDIKSADVAFAPGTVLALAAPVDHRFPLKRISGEGTLLAGRLAIPRLSLDLDGLKADVRIEATDVPAAPAGSLVVTARDVRVDDFRRFWPASAARGAQAWCTQHLRDGVVPQVIARLAFGTRDGRTEPTALDARFGVQRLTVDYLPPMPPVLRTTGAVTADLRTLRIEVGGGEAAGMTVSGGTIVFPDLERDPAFIDIDLAIDGPVPPAMMLISHPPLRYAAKIGIDPRQASGETRTRLHMNFPLLADLDADQIDIDAAVDLRDFGLAEVVRGIDVTDGQAHLDIDNHGLRAAGRLAVAGIPGTLDWRQAFDAGADPQTRASFATVAAPVDRVRRRLHNFFDLDSYLLGGTFAADIGVVVGGDGRGLVHATLDIGHAELSIPQLGWRKPSGTAGAVEAEVETDPFGVVAIPHAAVLAAGLDVGGSLRLRRDGAVEHAEIDHFIAGRTNFSATLASLADGSWDVTLGGLGLDLGPVIAAAGGDSGPGSGVSPHVPDLILEGDLETLWLGALEPIQKLQATMVHHDGLWPVVQLQGELGDGSGVELTIAPADGRTRSLSVSADNAGEALRAFDLYPDMIGGRLETAGHFDDADPAHPLQGRLHVDRFHIVKTPVLARLLSILALTGIRDALTGRGIAFSKLDMPFRLADKLLTIDGGRAYGSALGVTASGDLDLRADQVDLRGELVPFYAINSALGRLPLLGEVMTGGEKGGGVFSASYSVSGPLAEPNVSVNPVTVLFPGFLRWILETFEGWAGEPAAPREDAGNR